MNWLSLLGFVVIPIAGAGFVVWQIVRTIRARRMNKNP